MTQQAPEQAQFYLTASTPCPYLEGRLERKLFTHLGGRRAPILHELLAQHGFRRSQNIVYRPACEGCDSCRSARVIAAEFAPGKTQRRTWRMNADITGAMRPASATREQFHLFHRYLMSRHAFGGMTGMSYLDYEYMVEDTPVDSMLVEYRLPDASPEGRLAAVALTDVLPDGLSMVYSFFDPELADRSLGTYMILDHIRRTRLMELPYVYLGYWVENSPKMAYKTRFRPLELLAAGQRWQRLD